MRKYEKSKKVKVVVFDFDGTLSSHDANIEFGKYCFRHAVRPWLFLPLIGIGFAVSKFNPGGIWWRQTMRRFLTADMVKKFSAGFVREHKRNRFGWSAEQVAKEKAAGNIVLLISAGPDYSIPALARDMKFDAVVCSMMDKAYPWKYEFLCWGPNKVAALNEWARRYNADIDLVCSYSDSKTDLPIMRGAKEQVWIDPKTGARK